MRLSTLFFREAYRALLRHKLRSSLTTLGITIGIAAVVLVVAIGEAGSRRAEAELEKLGDNLVWIEAGSRNVAGTRTGTHGTRIGPRDDQAPENCNVKVSSPSAHERFKGVSRCRT